MAPKKRPTEEQATPKRSNKKRPRDLYFRLRDSRETALDVKMMLERASAACTRNGVGCKLLVRYYVIDAPWSSFSDREQATIKKTARAFEKRLRAEGFLLEEG